MRNMYFRFELAKGEILDVLEEMDKAIGTLKDCVYKLYDLKVVQEPGDNEKAASGN